MPLKVADLAQDKYPSLRASGISSQAHILAAETFRMSQSEAKLSEFIDWERTCI